MRGLSETFFSPPNSRTPERFMSASCEHIPRETVPFSDSVFFSRKPARAQVSGFAVSRNSDAAVYDDAP